MILRNSVFRLGNVHIWEVLSYKVVDFLIIRNYVFILRNVQIWAEPKYRNGEWRLQTAKCFDMNSAILQDSRYADVPESRFQCAKRSN